MKSRQQRCSFTTELGPATLLAGQGSLNRDAAIRHRQRALEVGVVSHSFTERKDVHWIARNQTSRQEGAELLRDMSCLAW